MPRTLAAPLALSLITVSGLFTVTAPAAAIEATFAVAAPAGFESLEGDRRVVVDAFYGGAKVGQVTGTITPGALRFDDPAAVARLLPDLVSVEAVAAALGKPLQTNASLVCRHATSARCGGLTPSSAGIIFDEDRFRVTIFLHPSLVAQADTAAPRYLEDPERHATMVSRFGATFSGSTRGDRSMHLQNRSIASLGALRLQSDSSVASRGGISFDNLTAQMDRRERRYMGGLFWAPGSELAGRRKVLGIGAMTQLDTRVDKELLEGTPISIFLQQPARVDVIVDGRVVTSQIYGAGHRLIDTSGMAGGSYDVELRIQEDGRSSRSEYRFFSKGSAMAPAGLPRLSAFAGFLQTDPHQIRADASSFFYQAGAAYRVSQTLGIDGAILGTRRKAIIEAGAALAMGSANLRVLGLASSSGDIGTALRASSYGRSAVSVSFDLRAVRSRDGRPLLPMSAPAQTFSDDVSNVVSPRGTYVQGVAVVDYRLGQAAMRLLGLYRRDGRHDATYNLAGSVDVPLVRHPRWDIRLQAEVRKSESDVSSFVGLRFLMNGGGTTLSGISGISRRHSGSGKSTKFVGETQAGWHHQLNSLSELTTDLAFGRNHEGSYARGSGNLRSSLFNARGDALHQMTDGRHTTQFAATADAAIAVGSGAMAVGGRDPADAAAIAIVSGAEADQEFEVLVDDVVRGTVTGDRALPLFLAPYETYEMRVRPRHSLVHGVDVPVSATLYPGNVAKIRWSATPLKIAFGRLIDGNGEPVADADIRGPHAVGKSDQNGYFQIESAPHEMLEIRQGVRLICALTLPPGQQRQGYSSVGDVICQ